MSKLEFKINKNDIKRHNECLICENKKLIKISRNFYKNKFVFFETSVCNKCLYIFRTQRPNLNWFLRNFKKRFNYQKKNKVIYINKNIEKYREERYKKTFNFLLNKINFKSVIDIGSGPGTGLKYLKSKNKEVYALEPDKSRAVIAKKNKINVIIKELEKIKNFKKFDLITCIQTLEHFQNPYQALKIMKNFMNENSYIYIEVPNFYNNVISFHDSFYLAHMSNFIPETFFVLLSRLNLKPLYQTFPQTDNGEINFGVLCKVGEFKNNNIAKKINRIKKIKKQYRTHLKSQKNKILDFNFENINDISMTWKPDLKVKNLIFDNIFSRMAKYNISTKKFDIFPNKKKFNFKRIKINKNLQYKKIN